MRLDSLLKGKKQPLGRSGTYKNSLCKFRADFFLIGQLPFTKQQRYLLPVCRHLENIGGNYFIPSANSGDATAR